MASQSEVNTALQPYRDVHIKIEVLDFDYYILDEISGLATSATFTVSADSDIRRSCNINMILQDEYNKNPLASNIYWKAGNPFWFDKYLRISIGITEIATNEIVWTNQGIYLINEPSVTYNATTNELHFEGVDLMGQLTGLRNGNLEGLDYVIEVGTNIASAVRDILRQQGFTEYVVFDPPQATTPYEIKVNAGGTSYDLLKQLRDINPDWEMFFDVDGVFYFQPIKDNFTNDVSITPFVTNDILQVLDVDFTLDTSFSEVKNYVEVYGGVIEAQYTSSFNRLLGQNAEIYINESILENIDENGAYFSTIIGDLATAPSLSQYMITYVLIYTEGGQSVASFELDNDSCWKYVNQSYVFKLYKEYDDNNDPVFTAENIGYSQPMGVAWDNNIDSPFYVGYYSSNNDIKEWDVDKSYSLNDICYYDNAYFKSRAGDNQGNLPIVTAQYSDWWTLLWNANGYTDAMYNKPQFERQVRIVLSGGEYDNIYSNQLAIERAKYEVYLRSTRHDNIELTIVPIYWLDVNQVIEYQLPNEDTSSYWLVKEVSTDFSMTGAQTITAIRYYVGQ